MELAGRGRLTARAPPLAFSEVGASVLADEEELLRVRQWNEYLRLREHLLDRDECRALPSELQVLRDQIPVTFLSDYGLALLRADVHRDFQTRFHILHLDDISTIDAREFTALFIITLNGADHSLSVDFDADIPNEILEVGRPGTVSQFVPGLVIWRELGGSTCLSPLLSARVPFLARSSGARKRFMYRW